MMRNGDSDDQNAIRELWQKTYPNISAGFLNFYFRNMYEDSTKVVYEQDDKITACMHMNQHVVKIGGRHLACSYISGICTAVDYRRRSQMDTLLKSLLDQASHEVLLTYVQAFNPKIFEPYGFMALYTQKQYTINEEMLGDTKSTYVTFDASSDELSKVYMRFMKRFDGFFVRDAKAFDLIMVAIKEQGKQLYVYSENAEIKGYIVCAKKANDYFVEEAIYLEPIVLARLLKGAMSGKKEVILCVSEHEHIERILPMAIGRKQASVMVRVNQLALFGKLFSIECSSSSEALAICKKPLWCNEYY